jgi:multidrug efflux system outer membrane protein
VSTTLVSQTKLAEVREDQERTVKAYQESVNLALLRYNQGLANYYEVLEAQQLLFPAQNDLARTQANQLIVVVDLYRALGGGWQLPDEVVRSGRGHASDSTVARRCTVAGCPARLST